MNTLKNISFVMLMILTNNIKCMFVKHKATTRIAQNGIIKLLSRKPIQRDYFTKHGAPFYPSTAQSTILSGLSENQKNECRQLAHQLAEQDPSNPYWESIASDISLKEFVQEKKVSNYQEALIAKHSFHATQRAVKGMLMHFKIEEILQKNESIPFDTNF